MTSRKSLRRQRINQTCKAAVLVIAASLLGGSYMRHGLSASAAVTDAKATRKKQPATKSDHARMADARALFMQNCARCHGADGRSETQMGALYGATDLTNRDWWKSEHINDRRLRTSIIDGRDGMPAFGKKLSKDQIAALVAYVRTFKEK